MKYEELNCPSTLLFSNITIFIFYFQYFVRHPFLLFVLRWNVDLLPLRRSSESLHISVQILFDQSHLMLPLHFMLPVILYCSVHSLPFNLSQKIILFLKIDVPDTELLVLPLISPILFIFCYILKNLKMEIDMAAKNIFLA